MFETEAERLAHIQDRIDTINRAIEWIEAHIDDVDLVFMTLNHTEVKQRLKEHPRELVAALREGISRGRTFSAWKASQQLCKAAGLKY